MVLLSGLVRSAALLPARRRKSRKMRCRARVEVPKSSLERVFARSGARWRVALAAKKKAPRPQYRGLSGAGAFAISVGGKSLGALGPNQSVASCWASSECCFQLRGANRHTCGGQ